MNVFRFDLAVHGDESLMAAAGAVVERLLSLPGPRSLCEIQADEEDYRWLCNWAFRLTSFRLRGWLEGMNSRKIALSHSGINLTYAESAGCMLLLLASESARRNASEGQVCPAVRERFPQQAANVLFVQGQPRGPFKDAIEAMSRKLDLRHVFGIEGTQNYYVSVYLQFGFTRLGMERLPFWLAGHPSTQAIFYLGNRGDRLFSASFASLWNTLRDYRRNNITKTRALQALKQTPWILPDWAENLLEHSGRHLELDVENNEGESSGEQADPEFLEVPRLQWEPPNPPKFLSSVVNLADFDLSADHYQIRTGATLLATIVSGEQGAYSSLQNEVILPAGSSEFPVSMVDENGICQASHLLRLWDAGEDVQLFDLGNGRRLDPYDTRLASTRKYGLLTSKDLDIQPPALYFQEIGTGRDTKRMSLVSGNDDGTVRVTLRGEEIWTSVVDGGVPFRQPEPPWARTVAATVLPTEPVSPDHYERSVIKVTGIRADCELRYVRSGGKPLDFHAGEGGDYYSEEFDVTEDSTFWSSSGLPEVKVKIGLRLKDEPPISVERTNILSVSGVLRATDEGWQPVNGLNKITVNEAMQVPYKVLPPSGASPTRDLALMEGPIYLRRLWRQPRPLGALGGYGAPLEIRRAYNPDTHWQLVVANEVHDPGVLDRVLMGSNSRIRLYLSYPVEPGPGHQIVVWNYGEPVRVIDAMGNVKASGDEWNVTLPEFHSEVEFVAIAYHGTRIGSSWPSEPPQCSMVIDGDTALETAALLKWMHAPIVAPEWLSVVRLMALQHPVPTLRAWLLDEGLTASLRHQATEEQWRAVVRQVFSVWNPDGKSAWELIQALAGESGGDPVAEALFALLREDPLLMGKVARQWVRSRDLTGVPGLNTRRGLMEGVRSLIAEVKEPERQELSSEQYELLANNPQLLNQYANTLLNAEGPADANGAGGDPFLRKEEELLQHASAIMDVDVYFLKHLLEQVIGSLNYNTLEPRALRNLEAALTVSSFREHLGLRVLSSLIEEIK